MFAMPGSFRGLNPGKAWHDRQSSVQSSSMFGVLYYIIIIVDQMYQLCWIGLRENHGKSTAPIYRGSCKFLRIYNTIQVWESQTIVVEFSLGGHGWWCHLFRGITSHIPCRVFGHHTDSREARLGTDLSTKLTGKQRKQGVELQTASAKL